MRSHSVKVSCAQQSAQTNLHSGRRLFTSSVKAHCVRVVLLSVDAAIVNDKLEGKVHEAAVAAVVALTIAINQHLFTQRRQGASGNCACTLHGAGGAERPAGAAQQLVLHLHDERAVNALRVTKARNLFQAAVAMLGTHTGVTAPWSTQLTSLAGTVSS